MTNAYCNELIATLANELVAVRMFIETLKEEQQLLVENSTDLLTPIAEQKSAQALKLNELIESGRAILQNKIPSMDNSSIESWLKVNCVDALSTWQQIHTLAEQAKQLNHINGELIMIKLRHNQQSLSSLTRTSNNAPLYGPNGQTSFKPGSGRTLGNG